MYIYEEEYFYKYVVKKEKVNVVTAMLRREEFYETFFIAKKNGEREINAIKKPSVLYEIQKNLKEYFYKYPISVAAKGFIPGESYFEFLKPHMGRKFYMRVDIKDFFGSITTDTLSKELSRGCKVESIVEIMVQLCTINDKLPQGGVTSPVLSNIAFTKVDQRIIKYCQSLITLYKGAERKANDIVYTRYADDMLFSSDNFDFKKSKYFLYMIKKILLENGYKINSEKTKYGYEEIVLSGFVVGKDIHLSRKKCQQINSILFYFDKRTPQKRRRPYSVNHEKISHDDMIKELNKLSIPNENGERLSFGNVNDLINYLCGYRAFLISMVRSNMGKSREEKDVHVTQVNKRIEKIQKLVDALAKHYEKV